MTKSTYKSLKTCERFFKNINFFKFHLSLEESVIALELQSVTVNNNRKHCIKEHKNFTLELFELFKQACTLLNVYSFFENLKNVKEIVCLVKSTFL